MASFSQVLFLLKRSTTRLTTTTRSTRRRTPTFESQSGGAQKTQLVLQRYRGKSLFFIFFKKAKDSYFCTCGVRECNTYNNFLEAKKSARSVKKYRGRKQENVDFINRRFCNRCFTGKLPQWAPRWQLKTIHNHKFARIIFFRQFKGRNGGASSQPYRRILSAPLVLSLPARFTQK